MISGQTNGHIANIELLRFLERYIVGLVGRDIITVLGNVPKREWTLAEITERVHRPAAVVAHHLRSLESAGIVIAHQVDGETYYMLAPDRRIRSLVRHLRERWGILPTLFVL